MHAESPEQLSICYGILVSCVCQNLFGQIKAAISHALGSTALALLGSLADVQLSRTSTAAGYSVHTASSTCWIFDSCTRHSQLTGPYLFCQRACDDTRNL